ncbi:hypothetical protein Hypma_012712 [Hypsizygus marmoreus]|uniref:DUF6533 domain-containing protein n=1 Tax=Hypsizygus marmoreus TaxID=39966 RepID=A0A369JNB8_HYPMA|nr:hypothetical protein Hypma_012712 [Hypsizygus marmoreus]
MYVFSLFSEKRQCLDAQGPKLPPSFVQLWIQYASVAMLYYDYILTFPLEIKYVWNAKFRFSTIVYFMCRYAVIGNVITLLNLSGSMKSRDAIRTIAGALIVLGRGAVIFMWSARTYAVCKRNRYILAFFTILGSAIVVISIIYVPSLTCTELKKIPSVWLTLMTAALHVQLVATVLATITAVHALKVAGIRRTSKNGFVFLVIEQCVIYFLFIFLFSVVCLIVEATLGSGFLFHFLNALILPISGLLTARFFLHLRQWRGTRRESDRSVTGTRIQFTTVLTTNLWTTLVDDFGEDPVYRPEIERRNAYYDMHGIP